VAGSQSIKLLALLRVLLRHEVEFLIVGGVAAQLEGAPIMTLDLDVLCSRAPANMSRLLAALREVKARYRDPAGRHIEPDAVRLATHQTHLLLTDLGPLDVLVRIGKDLGYEDLLGRTVVFRLEEASVRVLDLAAVIETKEHANREKDRAVLPVLRQTLALKAASDGARRQ
jgi:hypothetical protein